MKKIEIREENNETNVYVFGELQPAEITKEGDYLIVFLYNIENFYLLINGYRDWYSSDWLMNFNYPTETWKMNGVPFIARVAVAKVGDDGAILFVNCSFDKNIESVPWDIEYVKSKIFERKPEIEEMGWSIAENDQTAPDDTFLMLNRILTSEDVPSELVRLLDTLFLDIANKIYEDMTYGHDFEDSSEISLKFSFPEEIKVYCEQYLSYFAQFLKDIGVGVNTTLDSGSDYTIFKVAPRDKEEALEKIRVALGEYLKIPTVVSIGTPISMGGSIEIQRLQSTVQHLQSQIGLASVTMQQQSLLINAKDRIIDQQDQVIQQSIASGRILSDSIKADEKESEDVIAGVLAVKKYEFGPLEVDIPSIYKRLKDLFNK